MTHKTLFSKDIQTEIERLVRICTYRAHINLEVAYYLFYLSLRGSGIEMHIAYCIFQAAPDLGGGGDALKIKYNHYPNPSIHPSINQSIRFGETVRETHK